MCTKTFTGTKELNNKYFIFGEGCERFGEGSTFVMVGRPPSVEMAAWTLRTWAGCSTHTSDRVGNGSEGANGQGVVAALSAVGDVVPSVSMEDTDGGF